MKKSGPGKPGELQQLSGNQEMDATELRVFTVIGASHETPQSIPVRRGWRMPGIIPWEWGHPSHHTHLLVHIPTHN